MEILDYINSHLDTWQKDLTSAPYYLKINTSGNYHLLKYDMLNSDFHESIVREARGSIFYFDEDIEKYICVSHPFDKFFNFGEVYADTIDWNTASIQEKVDGSLIKFWWHANKWHISTNGLVDAVEANVESLVDNNLTFYDLVLRAIDENYGRVEFMTSLDKNYTYMFELVAKENKLVVSYDKTALYFLGRRDKRTDKEVNPDEDEQAKFFKMPRRFKFASLNDTIKFAETLDISQEGFVVCDANFNRIKIKGAAYLDAFHFRGNGLTKKKIIEAILHNTIDDMSAYFPEFHQEISQITVDFLATAKMLDVIFENIPENIMTSRKDIALYVQNFPKIIQGFIFYKLDNNGDGYSYMKERLNSDKILSLLRLDLPAILDEKKEN